MTESATPTLEVHDLHVEVNDKEILKGIDLVVSKGEVHAIMGPNGSGKTTLASALLGHPRYRVTQGEIRYRGENIADWTPDARARAGLFLSFQYPAAVPGVTLVNFLRHALNQRRGQDVPVREYTQLLNDAMAKLKVDREFARRYVNDGFSGGEKKRAEILQMAVLKPEIAILDETDSGLDVDALRIVAEGVNRLLGPDLGVVLITHYNRILNYITPNRVHILYAGRIVTSGGRELADEVEAKGYDPFIPVGAPA